MILPANESERHALYRHLLTVAELASRSERRERFKQRRALHLTGTEMTARARFNSLKEWSRLSSSLIYNAKGVKFGMQYPPYYGGRDGLRLSAHDLDEMAEIATEEFHFDWYNSEAPEVCGNAVSQAHYADTSWVKLYVNRNEVENGLVPDPSDMCVGDERLPMSHQEVFVHFFGIGLSIVHRLIAGLEPRERQRVWEAAQQAATPAAETRGDALPGALPRLVLAATSPTMIGSVYNTFDTALGLPQSKEPVVEFAEKWVWDDHARRVCARCYERRGAWRHTWAPPVGHEFVEGELAPDWRVVTMLAADLSVLWDPVNPLGIEGHPFFPLCLDPPTTANYTYGIAPMEDQIGLQAWSEYKLDQLNARDDLDLNPPISGYGVALRDGETTARYRKPGGDIPFSTPQGKIEYHRPPELTDKYGMLDRIETMRRLVQAIPKSMAGQTEAGVRSGEQAVMQALMGAGPTLDRAMAVERWLETIATARAKLRRVVSPRPLVRDNGERFLLMHLPDDFTMKVWAHSSSPIYTEHLIQKAFAVHKAGALSSEDLIILSGLPNTDALRRKSKQLEQGQAEMAKKRVELKEREVRAKEEKAMK